MRQRLASLLNKHKSPRWWWRVAGSAIVSAACLGLMARLVYGNLDSLLQIRGNLRLGPLLWTLPAFCLSMALAGWAWGTMMNAFALPRPMWDHLKIFMVTHAARRLPGMLWYIVGRTLWYERLGISKRVTTFGNVLETLFLVWSGLVISLTAMLLTPGEKPAYVWPFVVLLAVLSALFHPHILGWVLIRLGQAKQAGSLTYRLILFWFVLYLCIWLTGGTIFFLVLQAVYPAPWSLWGVSLRAWCLAGIAGVLIPLIPSGFGLSDATLSLILAAYVPPAIAVMSALLLRIVMTLYEFMFAFGVLLISRAGR